MNTINEKINEIISRKGLKQSYIVQKTGIAPTAMSNIVNGKRKIYACEFLSLCDVLGVNPNEFRTNQGDTK